MSFPLGLNPSIRQSPFDYSIEEMAVLLHNGGFCNSCITKWILLLKAFHAQETQYDADYDKKYYIFY
jgi:hypothetical protein